MILLIGASGMLGQTFQEYLNNQQIPFLKPTSAELNITNIKNVKNYFSANEFSIVINCAAYTKVDLAEDEQDECYKLNVTAVKILAQNCQIKGVKLVYFSTDYVYSGKSSNPYEELEAGNCINYYGQTKLDGEIEIMHNCSNYLILRVSWLYHEIYGKNFYKTMVNLGTQKTELNVVSDQIGCPTNCNEVVKTTIKALEKNLVGIYNFSEGETMSWADFAKKIMKKNDLECKINYITSDQYSTRAKRPKYSTMDNSKIKKSLSL